MRYLFPDLTSDPNDCYFEDLDLENEKNKRSEKAFFHQIDLRLTLNLNKDNRFAFNSPTVSSVSPFKGSIHGGQEIRIGGFNFGRKSKDIKEILVKGVICSDVNVLSPNLITCTTHASTILGPGPGNVIIVLKDDRESPKNTCNVFEYVGDKNHALNELRKTIKTVQSMEDDPIYLNTNYHDQDISLFDHLMLNHDFYKEKLKPSHENHAAIKIDNMVKQNYDGLISIVKNSAYHPHLEGFRKKRFLSLMGNLEPCDKNNKN